MTPPPETLDDLGLQGCFALGALLLAQSRRISVAPTRRMSLGLLGLLREQGVIDTPWPEATWPLDPSAEETPIERLQWRYVWPAYQRDGLLTDIEEFLDGVARDDYGLALRQRLWFDLGAAEAEQFFEAQLSKHRFAPAWAQDLAFVIRDGGYMMPIAQWRYCCWAATRHGASLAQQMAVPNPNAIREGIFAELNRRAQRVSMGDWGNCAFAPANPRPANAAGKLFTTLLTPLGPQFWTLPPSIDQLICLTTSRLRTGRDPMHE
ncbi:MAG: hypothetical protein JSR70_08210 [Proteobacteria bacterium]|nr:hypothetical protein [Pseudomonadota bacterium]